MMISKVPQLVPRFGNITVIEGPVTSTHPFAETMVQRDLGTGDLATDTPLAMVIDTETIDAFTIESIPGLESGKEESQKALADQIHKNNALPTLNEAQISGSERVILLTEKEARHFISIIETLAENLGTKIGEVLTITEKQDAATKKAVDVRVYNTVSLQKDFGLRRMINDFLKHQPHAILSYPDVPMLKVLLGGIAAPPSSSKKD